MAQQKTKTRTYAAKKNDSTTVLLTVREPSLKETQASQRAYRSGYTKALLDGLPTRSVLLKRLEENNLWSPKDRQEFSELREAFIAANTKLVDLKIPPDKEPTPEQAQVIAEREEALAKLNSKRADVESMLQFTADSLAEDDQNKFLTACTTVRAATGADNGKRYFQSVEELNACDDGDLAERVKYEYITFANDQESQWDELTAPKPAKPATTTPPPGETSEKKDAAPADTKAEGSAAAGPKTDESPAGDPSKANV